MHTHSKNKKIFFKILFFILFAFFTTVGLTYSFDGETHTAVTRTSLEIISELKLQKEDSKINFNNFYDKKYWSILEQGSVDPDTTENDGANKYHFYNVRTGRTFTNKKNDLTAKDMFESHYKKAIEFYKNGTINKAYEELGRCLHYLEDGCTAVHTSYEKFTDGALWLVAHVSYENVCRDIIKTERPKVTICEENLIFYELNSLSGIMDDCCGLSASNFALIYGNVCLYKHKSAFKPHSVEEIARNSIKNAQTCVVGLLYKFYKEVCGNAGAHNEKLFNLTNTEIKKLGNDRSEEGAKHIIERGKIYDGNVVSSEKFVISPEQKFGEFFKREVSIGKDIYSIGKGNNSKSRIRCVKKFSFVYDKKKFVFAQTENDEGRISTSKINYKKSKWGMADTSKIMPSKNGDFCLVSSIYTVFKKSSLIDECHTVPLQYLHADVFCSKYGNIGVNSDI